MHWLVRLWEAWAPARPLLSPPPSSAGAPETCLCGKAGLAALFSCPPSSEGWGLELAWNRKSRSDAAHPLPGGVVPPMSHPVIPMAKYSSPGKPGCCIVQRGPGGARMVPQARKTGSPLLLLPFLAQARGLSLNLRSLGRFPTNAGEVGGLGGEVLVRKQWPLPPGERGTLSRGQRWGRGLSSWPSP